MILPISFILSYALFHWKKTDKITYTLLIVILLLPLNLFFIANHLSTLSQSPSLGNTELDAINWINENTNEDDTILNFIRRVETGAFVGDAGQWIPVITGRKVVFPATSLTDNINISEIQDRQEIMEMTEEKKTEKE